MTHYLLHFKNWITKVGFEENKTEIYNAKARIFTYMMCLVLFIQLLLFIAELVTMDLTGIAITSSFISFGLVLLAIHHFKGLNVAAPIFNILYSTIMGLYLITVGKGDGIEYSFFIFMASSVIFQKKFITKFLLVFYCILLFIAANIYLAFNEPLLIRPKEQSDEIAVFVTAAICFFCIIYIFNKELEKYFNKSRNLVVSLKQQNNTLTQLNEELERFAFIASHDLKTPLLNIINFSDLLKKKINGTNDKDAQKYISFISDGGYRMKNLIEDLLEYTEFTQKEQQPEVKKERIDLHAIVKEIESSISSTLINRNAVIELVGNLPKINWIRFKIFILFKNIIENGIKYNKSAHPIIKISSKQSPNHFSISFEDNGIGIKEEFQSQIFGLFKRLHGHAEFEGSGLGLATCKKIVEELGGQIYVESEVGKKTIFIIDLPLTRLADYKPKFQTHPLVLQN